LERKYRAAVGRVEKLTPSVLAKAFRGELVQQDPNDEPAVKMLERIKAERDAESSTASTLKRRKSFNTSVRKTSAKKRGRK
jgi:type I restriction enzyme S subunit